MKSFNEWINEVNNDDRNDGSPQNATITGTMNGKVVTVEVELKKNSDSLYWVKKTGNKPFFGTTGYYYPETRSINTYRGKTIMSNVDVRWS